MDRDEVCKYADEPEIDGTRNCGNETSDRFNNLCGGVHACKDGVVKVQLYNGDKWRCQCGNVNEAHHTECVKCESEFDPDVDKIIRGE